MNPPSDPNPPSGPSAAKTIVLNLPPEEKPGDKIDRYKLLQILGEGGCGIVYMAEQEEPVRRRVALKVIKLGMDTKQVIARFEAERQALAMMDHPNIAKVLDAGATEKGRSFFVMELVRGIKITDYCDQNKLSTRERLDALAQVCVTGAGLLKKSGARAGVQLHGGVEQRFLAVGLGVHGSGNVSSTR